MTFNVRIAVSRDKIYLTCIFDFSWYENC